jgi:DNA-binding protein HU-beta
MADEPPGEWFIPARDEASGDPVRAENPCDADGEAAVDAAPRDRRRSRVNPSHGGDMTKAEMLQKVAKRTSLSQAQTAKVLDATLGEIRALLGKGGAISFTGFGSFATSKRSKRKGRNPQTGKEMIIPASRVARFRAGKALKEAVSGKKK